MSRHHSTNRLAAAVLAILTVAGTTEAAPPVVYQLTIQRQPLDHALREFATQSGMQIIHFSSLTDGYYAPELHGKYTSTEALERLLSESGLTFQELTSTTIQVRPRDTVTQTDQITPRYVRIAQTEPVTPAPAAAEPEQRSALDEIVVTATRREEKLQSVPIAVTALTSDAIKHMQLADVGALQRSVPSLYIAPFGDASTAMISLRGQVATDNVVANDPAVGVYLDGVYIARSTGGNLNLIDVERVEVLRGPQGTLFGRNTIGGAVSITPKKPTDNFQGSVTASYGNYDAVKLTGIVNLPVSDAVAVRLVGQHSERDGFARSTLNGTELNGEDIDYFRGAVSFDLPAEWNLLLAGDYTDSVNDGQWVTLVKTFPLANTVANAVSGGTLTASQFIDPFAKRLPSQTEGPFKSRNWGASATLEGKFGEVNFKSISSYREMKRELHNFDQDGTPFQLLQLALNQTDQDQFSQELQLYGKVMGERLDWIIGAYYFTEDGEDEVFSRFVYPINPNYNVTNGVVQNDSAAIYGQVTYQLTDRLSAVGGIRYTRDTRELTVLNRTSSTLTDVVRCNTVGAVLPTCDVSAPKADFDYFPFTIGLNYTPIEDVLFYGKWSRGFRSGGFNLRASSSEALIPFDPEQLDSFEIGAKVDLARNFRINAAIFRSKFKDIQFNATRVIGVGVTSTIVDNAGEAEIDGVELEANAVFGDLRLGANVGYLDAKYTDLKPNVIGVTLDSEFQQTPKWTYGVSADYSLPRSFGSVDFHADYSWRDEAAYAPIPPADPDLFTESYGVVNGRLGVELNSGFTVSLWGRNLTDKNYMQRIQNLTGAGFLSGYPGDPRTYGVSLEYEF